MMSLHHRIALAALLVVVALPLGCRTPSWAPPETVRIAVMPFAAPGEITERPFQIRGWWFGAHDIRQSPNVGHWMSDSLAREMMQLTSAEVIPQHDLRRYLLGQERRLRRAYPDLTDEEIATLMREIPLSDFGRDLGLDKIITGQVHQAQMTHHRTVHTWVSTIECTVQVWDVRELTVTEDGAAPPAPEWETRMSERDWFGSWMGAADALSEALTKRMRRDYFGNPGHFTDL